MECPLQTKSKNRPKKLFTRRMGEIYFGKILPVPQPPDHKTGDETMKWKSHSTPTGRLLQACSIVSKAKARSAGKYTVPGAPRKAGSQAPAPTSQPSGPGRSRPRASCSTTGDGAMPLEALALTQLHRQCMAQGRSPGPRQPWPLCGGVPGKDAARRVFVVMTVVDSHCSQK